MAPLSYAIDDNSSKGSFVSPDMHVAGSESRSGSVMLSNHGIIPPSLGTTIEEKDTRCDLSRCAGRRGVKTGGGGGGERLEEGTRVRTMAEMPGYRDRTQDRYRVARGGGMKKNAAWADRLSINRGLDYQFLRS